MKFKIKKTPFLFLSLLLCPFFLLGGLYYLLIANYGGRALAGSIFIFGLFINLFLLLIEQTILRNIKISLKVYTIEIIVIILIFIFLRFGL